MKRIKIKNSMVLRFSLLSVCGILVFCFRITVARVAIVNGGIAGVDQFPYQVSLQIRGLGHDCGGGVISEQFILTAAHCVVTEDGHIQSSALFALVGTNYLYKTGKPAVEISVRKIFVPKEFNLKFVGGPGDIAVLMLEHPLPLSPQIKKLELPEHKDENYTGKAVIAGFGWNRIIVKDNKVLDPGHSDHLRFAIATILEDCSQANVKNHNTEQFLCAKVLQRDISKPRGTCIGDSGGPLVHKSTVIGILSVGPKNCLELDVGAVYTRVSHYLNFIDHAIHNKPHEDTWSLELHN